MIELRNYTMTMPPYGKLVPIKSVEHPTVVVAGVDMAAFSFVCTEWPSVVMFEEIGVRIAESCHAWRRAAEASGEYGRFLDRLTRPPQSRRPLTTAARKARRAKAKASRAARHRSRKP